MTNKGTTFTWIGWAVVIIFIITFIRTRAVTMLLGVILLGMVLINYNTISSKLFHNPPKLGS